MKALKSNHFLTVLQIATLFKIHAKNVEKQLTEGLKLMTVDELYTNIVHDQYETTLMRDIIIFLISKVNSPKFQKSGNGGAIHFFNGDLRKYREEIMTNYYMQIALEQYYFLSEDDHDHKEFANVLYFYELSEEMKFKVLEKLSKNVADHLLTVGKSKEKEESNEQSGNDKEERKFQEILVLGEDNKYAYYFAPFLPQFVITYDTGSWALLDKSSAQARIVKLLKEPMNVNTLCLCESLSTISSKYMKSQPEAPIHLHKVKESHAAMKKDRMLHLKKKLFQINERYCGYLKNFDNQCWGYLNQREQYMDLLQKSVSLDDLIEAFKFMYLCSSSKIFKCLCDEETQVPEKDYQQFYEAKLRPFCNIHNVSVKIWNGFSIKSSDLTVKIIQENHADSYALFELSIHVLVGAMQRLEQKQKKYAEKSKLKQKSVTEKSEIQMRLRPKEKSSRNSESSLSSSVFQKARANLRQRKKSKNKKFGITMIDSDESFDQISQMSGTLDEYRYKKGF